MLSSRMRGAIPIVMSSWRSSLQAYGTSLFTTLVEPHARQTAPVCRTWTFFVAGCASSPHSTHSGDENGSLEPRVEMELLD